MITCKKKILNKQIIILWMFSSRASFSHVKLPGACFFLLCYFHENMLAMFMRNDLQICDLAQEKKIFFHNAPIYSIQYLIGGHGNILSFPVLVVWPTFNVFPQHLQLFCVNIEYVSCKL